MSKEPFKPDPEDITKVYVNDNISVQRVVVCAACKYGDTIIAGARHFDSVMHSQLDAINWKDETKRMTRTDQGFIDQWGNYMSRKEAYYVALASGQRLRNPKPSFEFLFSEDLY